ncbi:MAG: acyl-CoA-binding protein [Pseudomonadota bacterium]
MDLKSQFTQASEDVKKISSRPDNQTLLELYALFKQATEGDVQGSRPGMLDIRGRAKFDAWTKKKGVSAETAMKDYIALVSKLTQ